MNKLRYFTRSPDMGGGTRSKDIVELLLLRGADADRPDIDTKTALDVAKAEGRVEIIELLM